MHNAAFAALGVDAVYLPFSIRPEGLGRLLKALSDLEALGLNVTIPHKQKVLAFLDKLDPTAQRIGAVNTVVFRNGQRIGYNTDGLGFLAAVRPFFPPRGGRAVLFGAGGAGRAVAVTLADAGLQELTVVDPVIPQRRRLLAHLRRLGYAGATGFAPDAPQVRAALTGAGLIVNASPLGWKASDPLPAPEAAIPRGVCVMDLVYGHGPTRFLRAAARRGCRTVPGWSMLLHQGAEAFRLWTGRKPPILVMEKALRRAGV